MLVLVGAGMLARSQLVSAVGPAGTVRNHDRGIGDAAGQGRGADEMLGCDIMRRCVRLWLATFFNGTMKW